MSDDRNSKNPKNTVGKILKAAEERKKLEDTIIENQEDYALALNGLAVTPNGKHFLKTLIKACHVFTPKSGLDGVALIETNTKRNLYLEFIRPYLEPAIRKDLEN